MQQTEIRRMIAVTESDTAEIPLINYSRGGRGMMSANRVWVGTSGSLVLVTQENDVITLSSVIAGRWHKFPPGVKYIKTDSGAAGIILGLEM